MKLDLPPQLEPIRRILEGSLRLRASESAPSLPVGLLDDLNQRFASQRIVIEPRRQVAWGAKLRRLVATPAFGLAAAAMLVFGVVTPFVSQFSGPETADGFRGATGAVGAEAMIVLVHSPADLENTLAHSGQFEADSIVSAGDMDAALQIPGAKVILDFESATVVALDNQGNTVHASGLPANLADLTLTVADALSHL